MNEAKAQWAWVILAIILLLPLFYLTRYDVRFVDKIYCVRYDRWTHETSYKRLDEPIWHTGSLKYKDLSGGLKGAENG
jgi:hypothetical protein